MRAWLAASACAALLAGCARPAATAGETWRPEAAAAYLDRRADWWMTWRQAARDRGTFCVSCHTTLPYALARPALRAPAAATELTEREQKILDNVRTRVRQWNHISPYYGARTPASSKAAASRATEAVIDALILSDADARTGRLGHDTRLAFDHMWALQETSGPRGGAWPWLDFGLDPWEGGHGEFFGAALAALAAGTAPAAYATEPAIQPKVDRLRRYLGRAFDDQPLSNRAVLLLAAARLPGVVNPEQRARLAEELDAAQQRDGGWSLETLLRMPGWTLRRLVAHSDGYATGLVTLALLRCGGSGDVHAANGLAWLARHQDPADGSWPADSPNTGSPSPDSERFMSDAATGFAVLALTDAAAHVR